MVSIKKSLFGEVLQLLNGSVPNKVTSRFSFLLSHLMVLLFFLFFGFTLASASSSAQWAKSVVNASYRSYFKAVAVDTNGNIYSAGYMEGSGSTYDFGNGVTVTGKASKSAVLVKYDSSGIAQWAKSVISGTVVFNAIAVDTSGNIYCVGYIAGDVDFGNGVTDTGVSDSVLGSVGTAALVKYDSNGVAQWAKSVISGPADSYFDAVAVDASGNSYCSGNIVETLAYSGVYNFGNEVAVVGGYKGYNVKANNPVLVKYDSNGVAQWAKSTVIGPSQSLFNAVAVDTSGNSYGAGDIWETGTFDFGNGITVTGVNNANTGGSVSTAVLVKYDSNGVAQWVKSFNGASPTSSFDAVAVDASGNIYAVGEGKLLKYDSNGVEQWTSPCPNCVALAVDASGNIYGTGYIHGIVTSDFGNGVTAIGIYSSGGTAVLVKYDSNGVAQWAKSIIDGSSESKFEAVAADASGNIYGAGYIRGTGTYNFGNEVTVAGDYRYDNAVLVKYTDTTTSTAPMSTTSTTPQSTTSTTTSLPTTSTTTATQTTKVAITPSSTSRYVISTTTVPPLTTTNVSSGTASPYTFGKGITAALTFSTLLFAGLF